MYRTMNHKFQELQAMWKKTHHLHHRMSLGFISSEMELLDIEHIISFLIMNIFLEWVVATHLPIVAMHCQSINNVINRILELRQDTTKTCHDCCCGPYYHTIIRGMLWKSSKLGYCASTSNAMRSIANNSYECLDNTWKYQKVANK